MKRGVIKSFDPARGFGFIVPLEAGPDILLHSSILGEVTHLRAGTRCLYREAKRARGIVATAILFEASFTVLDLPDCCSHRYAVKCDNNGAVAVFNDRSEIDEWCKEQNQKVFYGHP